MIIAFVGHSGSAKSTMMYHLINHLGFVLPDWFTTRKPRNDKSDDAYIFLSVQEFLQKNLNGELENASVVYDNLYATNFPNYKLMNYSTVIDVEGFARAKVKYGDELVGVYMECDEAERATRMFKRGDKPASVTERIETDRAKFKKAYEVCEYKISSSTPEQDIYELIDILRDIENWKGVELIGI